MDPNYIEKYFDHAVANLERHLNNPNLHNEERERIKIRIELINELRDNVSWQTKSVTQKQCYRIQTLASMRKTGALPKFIIKQQSAIHIYELIKITIPYLEAINSGETNRPIIDFCNEMCDSIDFYGPAYRGDFSSIGDTEKVFKVFFDVVKPAQGNGEMFEECYQRIESLYNELKELQKLMKIS